jgi:hypothetical protein
MHAPAIWFLASGLLVLFVSRSLRATTKQLAVRRGLASADA